MRPSGSAGDAASRLRHPALLALLTLVVLALFHPLLTRHALEVHDSLDTYLRADGYLRELGAGHVPPQLFADAVSGGGYALPRFYPPLGYLVAAALAAPTGDVVLGVHLALLLSVVASAWAMYLLVHALTGRAGIAALGALLYVTFPYRFTDALQRSAVAESWTFVWFPLLFAGAWQAIRGGRVPWYFALSVAALLLTHTTTALYFAVVCAAVALLARRYVPASVTRRLVLETVVGIALAGWFLVPQVWYLPGVQAADPVFMWATPEHADQNRLTIDLLVHRFPAPNGLDLGVGLLGAALPLVALLRRRVRKPGALDPRVSRLGLALALTWVACLAFMIAPMPALMVLPASFAYIQFPWRLLGLAGFLAATAVALMAAELRRATRAAVAVLAAAVTLGAALPPSHRRVPTNAEWTTADVVAIGRGSYSRLGYTILGEYLPRGEPADSVNARIQSAPEASAGTQVLAWRRAGSGWTAEVQSGPAGEVTLPLVGYDVYRVVDQQGTRLATRAAGGLLSVRVSQGRHELEVTRRRTGVELAGLALSLVGLAGFALLRRV